MGIEQEIFQRNALLFGSDVLAQIANKKVIIFGVGGVGSWCAESLVRSGISHLTMVDSDHVCASNVNRQLMATTQTIGQVKTEVLKRRLLEINPNANITAIQGIYSAETRDNFQLEEYDIIIDAIDSLKDKVDLILTATSLKKVKFYASMGAALKVDPTRIAVAEFWDIQYDPLARALRKRFKRDGKYPSRKFKCVYSKEVLENRGANEVTLTTASDPAHDNWSSTKAQINGTVAHITAIFGFTLAGLVIQDIYNDCLQANNS